MERKETLKRGIASQGAAQTIKGIPDLVLHRSGIWESSWPHSRDPVANVLSQHLSR